MTVGRRIEIRGIVQGVGFRPWVYRLAVAHGVGGRVRNDPSGVTLEIFGSPAAIDGFADRLRQHPPPAADIREMRTSSIAAEPLAAFSIVASDQGTAATVSIPADLATCDDCLKEIGDAANRRHGYAFTTCTACGPRFTIADDTPYDRERTTMRSFEMCEACRAEYERPEDRRFHAEPNACPVCGPRLTLVGSDGAPVAAADPLGAAVRALGAGSIVAIKGLGGFHLACDATSHAAVARLRQRKRRDEKPFAVMVASIADARRVAVIGGAARQALSGAERPIILARRRPGAAIADNVAPDLGWLGVMLPYTPLHHLLLARVHRPLVMTSGNISDEPLVFRNADAIAKLGPIADLILLHDREIASPCDDSVVSVLGGAPVLLRRSRGFVPVPIAVQPPFDQPVLACGALLKNTYCIGIGEHAYFGPHIGDLANDAAHRRYVESIDRMMSFLHVTPGIIAHDLHPDYLSTQYALSRPEPLKIGVQHHHAHIVSAMAEHGLPGPVIGVAFDGTGYGLDGAAWGGEVMIADRRSFERVATLRPVLLAGGDQAIRHPWRLALALLDDAFEGRAALDGLRLFERVDGHHVDIVRQMIAGRVNAPPAHGAGRYFDAVASLALARPTSAYEGQLALQWNTIADDSRERYPFDLGRRTTPWEIDLRAMVRGVVADVRAGVPAATIAARFHNTLGAAAVATVRLTARVCGRRPVVLTGGCFQNPRLTEGVAGGLAGRFSVHLHHRVPPGDGGIALGQAAAAATITKGA